MSYVDFDRLRSANDTQTPFFIRKIPFSTSQIKIDTQYEMGYLCRAVRIVNNDIINSVTYRIVSPSNLLETVEPATEAVDRQWTSYIEINPNPASGNGIIELELVRREDAYR